MNQHSTKIYDLLVIGGGINGVGIARDAAGCGLSVVLCEKGDLASGTSSTSTKLIHGGLRYLEHFAFGLVRESLKEREILLHAAPYLVQPLTFIMPYQRQRRPKWMIQLGMFLYDNLAGRKLLKASRRLRFAANSPDNPLKDSIKEGFSYSDCSTDDSRLVVINALSAIEEGAHIHHYTECISATRTKELWTVECLNHLDKSTYTVQAKAVVNASGPWVDKVLSDTLRCQSPHKIQHVKGSHIVVPKLYDHSDAYILQHSDKRVIFVIPYQGEYSMIGTTDVHYQGSLDSIGIDNDEVSYLCDAVNHYFNTPVQPEDVLYSWSGVRPLLCDNSKNASAASRDYKIDVNTEDALAPLFSVFGGKLTTYRHLSEDLMEQMRKLFPHMKPAWTEEAILPGGSIPGGNMRHYQKNISAQMPFIPNTVLERYLRLYGSRTEMLIQECKSISDLGEHLFYGVYERELHFLIRTELARTAHDILFRRTKIGLMCSPEQIRLTQTWINTHYPEYAALAKE